MTTSVAPKAFISHSSDDKDRFVLGFATKLRERGVDAWLDRWEIKAGDSLVRKIFEEGIKNANAFLVVLSSQSIAKRWVREEQIVSAIFGTSDRPPIGTPPAHSTATIIDYLPALTKVDNLVFGVLCRHYLKTSLKHIGINEVYDDLAALELSDQELSESLEILGSRGYANVKRAGHDIYLVELYTFSLDEFMRTEVKEYDHHIATLISKIVNENQDSSTALHESTGIPISIILHILDLLENRALLRSVGPAGLPVLKIVSVSAELKRLLR